MKTLKEISIANIYMSLQIKPLKGFENMFNNESNTLSLLVKSDYDLYEHIDKSKRKLKLSLTCILNHFKDSEIKFYHKILCSYKNRSEYLVTTLYKISLFSLKRDLDDSFKEVIESFPNKFFSHFINIIIKKNDKLLKLDDKEFIKLNHIIRCSISSINNKQLSFLDNIPFEKPMRKIEKKNAYITKQSKIINKKYLRILKQHIKYLTI